MATPMGWSRRLTGNLGRRLQQWGAALTEWAEAIQAPEANHSGESDGPPAHWQALLKAQPGPLPWFGRNYADPIQPPSPAPDSPPAPQPPLKAARVTTPLYPAAPEQSPIPTVRFEPWPAQQPPVTLEPPPIRPARPVEPDYPQPAPTPPTTTPEYVSGPLGGPGRGVLWPPVGSAPRPPTAPVYPTLLPTPLTPPPFIESQAAPSADVQAVSAPPVAAPPGRSAHEPRFTDQATPARPAKPEYAVPVTPARPAKPEYAVPVASAAAPPLYTPWPGRAPRTTLTYVEQTIEAPAPSPAYASPMLRRMAGSAEMHWATPPTPAPSSPVAPTVADLSARQAPQTPPAWNRPVTNEAHWPELPAWDSAANDGPRPLDPCWEEFRREQNGARLRRGV